jgi:hypothetical protein
VQIAVERKCRGGQDVSPTWLSGEIGRERAGWRNKNKEKVWRRKKREEVKLKQNSCERSLEGRTRGRGFFPSSRRPWGGTG